MQEMLSEATYRDIIANKMKNIHRADLKDLYKIVVPEADEPTGTTTIEEMYCVILDGLQTKGLEELAKASAHVMDSQIVRQQMPLIAMENSGQRDGWA